MAGTNHIIKIYSNGVSSTPLAVNPGDTVQWSCPSASESGDAVSATGASITFTDTTQNGPFTEPQAGLGGTVDITNNGTTAKYTVADQVGTYPYEVVPNLEGGPTSPSIATIHVTFDSATDRDSISPGTPTFTVTQVSF